MKQLANSVSERKQQNKIKSSQNMISEPSHLKKTKNECKNQTIIYMKNDTDLRAHKYFLYKKLFRTANQSCPID